MPALAWKEGRCKVGTFPFNGACGYFFDCKSSAETCADSTECCSGDCGPFDAEEKTCQPGATFCLADSGCLSGSCRGFMCPEFFKIAVPLCGTDTA